MRRRVWVGTIVLLLLLLAAKHEGESARMERQPHAAIKPACKLKPACADSCADLGFLPELASHALREHLSRDSLGGRDTAVGCEVGGGRWWRASLLPGLCVVALVITAWADPVPS